MARQLQSHYRLLLGLEKSWQVSSVDLQVENSKVVIHVEHSGAKEACSECGEACIAILTNNDQRGRGLSKGPEPQKRELRRSAVSGSLMTAWWVINIHPNTVHENRRKWSTPGIGSINAAHHKYSDFILQISFYSGRAEAFWLVKSS